MAFRRRPKRKNRLSVQFLQFLTFNTLKEHHPITALLIYRHTGLHAVPSGITGSHPKECPRLWSASIYYFFLG